MLQVRAAMCLLNARMPLHKAGNAATGGHAEGVVFPFTDGENFMRVDLHVHTYFTDGTQSPEEIAVLARQKGLGLISVCDHDSIEAYPRLRVACEKEGVGLTQGVEIDVLWEGKNLHLLAYAFDPADSGMISLLSKNRYELDALGVDLIRNMQEDFPTVHLAEFEQYTYPRERGGWASINYLFDKGLSQNLLDGMKYRKYCRYQPCYTDIDEACRIVKAAGGIPVLAHPGVSWDNKQETLLSKLTALKACGIEGIECYYPWHTEAFTRICVDFCCDNHLYITCGGDGHGEFGRFIDGVEYYLGVMDVDSEQLSL